MNRRSREFRTWRQSSARLSPRRNLCVFSRRDLERAAFFLFPSEATSWAQCPTAKARLCLRTDSRVEALRICCLLCRVALLSRRPTSALLSLVTGPCGREMCWEQTIILCSLLPFISPGWCFIYITPEIWKERKQGNTLKSQLKESTVS